VYKNKDIWDIEVNPYISTIVCSVIVVAIWNYQAFDLIGNFYTSALSIVVMLFAFYNAWYSPVRSLVLATLLSVFALSIIVLRFIALFVLDTLVLVFSLVNV
jgi:hypothetical protein